MSSSPASSFRTCLAVAVCVALLAVSAGSANAQVGGSPQASGQTYLRIGFLQSIDSLNPYIGINDASYVLYGLLYDNLFSLDQDGNSVPNLALTAQCDASCMNWTYQIRSGVLWSDGTPLTADDVAFTINYDSQNLNRLYAYEPYMNQVVLCTAATRPYCGAAVTSPGNVTVYFQRPFVAGRALYVPIVQAAQWSGIPPLNAQTNFANPTPIGTGPFIADPNIYNEWLQNGAVPLHVTRNPNYHPIGSHTGPAVLSDIYLYVYYDQNSLVLALENGDVDLAQLSYAGYSFLQGIPNIQVQAALQATQFWNEIGFSQLDTPSANGRLNPARFDVNVRRALAHATNKDFIINQFYGGHAVRGAGLLSPLTPQYWFDPVSAGDNLTFSIAQANQILNVSGYYSFWTDATGSVYRQAANDIVVSYQTACYQCLNPANVTKTIPAGTHLEFTLAVRPPYLAPEETNTALYLQAQWAQIGVKVDIKVEPTEVSLAVDVYSGYVEAYIWYWSADPDPNYLLSMESSWTLDGWNDNYWNNATYNHYYLAQLGDLNPNQRALDVRAAQRINYESASYIVYAYPFGHWGMRTDTLQNWGDWAAHPYRQLVTFWGANPLFLEVAPVGPPNQPPSTPVIGGTPPILVQSNVNVSFTGTSTDPDPNETITWTWSWGDGARTVITTTSATQSVTASHAWVMTGMFTVQLTVSDGALSATSAGFAVNVEGVSLADAYGQPGASTHLSGSIVETSKGRWILDFGDGSSTSGTFPAGGAAIQADHVYASVGTYTATLTAKMGSITASANARVVIDGTPPVVTVPPSFYVNATGNLTPLYYAVTATDNVGVARGPYCTITSGTALPIGTYEITCYAIDLAGNYGYASFNVTIRDITPPHLFVPPFVVAEAMSPAGAFVPFSVNATDNVAVVSGPSCAPSSGSLFPLGTTVVLCSATDSSGNLAFATFTVAVVDTTPPWTYLYAVSDGNGYSVANGGRTPSPGARFSFVATDAVGVVSYVCALDSASPAGCASPAVVTGLSPGEHTFALAGVDAAGNYALVTFRWTVMSPADTVRDLASQVVALGSAGKLTIKQVSALLTPLNRTLTDLRAGKVSMAIKELKSFRALLNQYVASGILSSVDAQPLLNESADLILVLGGRP